MTCRTRGRGSSSLLPLVRFGGHSLDIRLIDGEKNVLRLDVCVDDLTLAVEVVQALENLQCSRNTEREIGGWLGHMLI